MSIFKDKSSAVARLKAQFKATEILTPLCQLDTPTLYSKLLAAESQVAGRLRVLLEATKVFCSDNDNSAAIAALPPGTPYREDPGYDYDPEFFQGNAWGLLVTRQIPIISVEQYRFTYINPNVSLLDIPLSWLRVDRKYGRIRLVPNGETSTIPLSAYLLSAFGGGRTLPNFIQVIYTAGIKDINAEYPDLVDFIYRYAAWLIIRDLFPGGSSSISIDGMSQSQGFDIKAYGDAKDGMIEGEIRVWLDRLHGVRMVVA